MPNARPNARAPNVTYIPPAHVGSVGACVGSGELHIGSGGFALGQGCFALGPQGFLDTNMLVSAKRNTRVGGKAQHEQFRFAVEYRLESTL